MSALIAELKKKLADAQEAEKQATRARFLAQCALTDAVQAERYPQFNPLAHEQTR